MGRNVGRRARSCKLGRGEWLLRFFLVLALAWPPLAVATTPARWVRVHAELAVEGSLRLAQGPDRMLWIAGGAGVTRFDGVQFRPIEALDGVPVRDLAFDREGSLWIAAASGLYRARGLDVEQVAMLDDGLHSHVGLWPDPASEEVWLATPRGLFRWQGQPGLTAADAVVARVFYSIGRTTDGRLLAGGSDGLWHGHADGPWEALDAAGGLVYAIVDAGPAGLWTGGYRLRRHAADGSVLEVVPDIEFVRVISALSNGELWVGTHGRGLWIRSPEGQWRAGEPRLAGEMITAIREDVDHNVWVATEAGELHQFVLSPMSLTTTREGLGGQLVSALAATADGGVWAAIYGMGIQHIGADGHPSAVIEGCQGDTRTLATDAAGVLWIGGLPGLCMLDGDEVLATSHRERVDAVLATDAGLWIASLGTLHLWRDGRIESEHRLEGWIEGNTQVHLLAQPAGGLWVGHEGGLWSLDVKGGQQQAVHREVVRGLVADAEGGLWWLGDGVLGLVMDQRQLASIEVDARFWLPVTDQADGLWLFGPRGVRRYSQRELRAALSSGGRAPAAIEYGSAHGLESLRNAGIGGPSMVRLADGRVAVAGYGKVMLGSLADVAAASPVMVSGLELRNRLGMPVDAPLRADELPLSMSYTAATYRDADRLLFRHRLWPIEQQWSAPSTLRERSYGGLAAGAYRFEVQSLGVHGDAPSAVAVHDVVVLPRWHERLDVRLALAGAVLLLLAASLRVWLRWRLQRFAARQRELEDMVGERTRQLAAANLELERLARTDALTGLLNRRGFEEAAGALFGTLGEASGRLALIALDVDHFKAYNDRYGHGEGDACLRAVGQCLAASVRAGVDIAARMGGEEFVVLIPGADAESARRRAEELRAGVELRGLPHAGNSGPGVVTVSLGVALAGPADHGWESVLARADGALYAAKRSGRNRVEMAD